MDACPECGSMVQSGTIYCKDCGLNLSKVIQHDNSEDLGEKSQMSKFSQPSDQSTTNVCKKCNSNNKLDAKFCINCGEKLFSIEKSKETTETIYCNQCGITNSSKSTFCRECGTTLNGSNGSKNQRSLSVGPVSSDKSNVDNPQSKGYNQPIPYATGKNITQSSTQTKPLAKNRSQYLIENQRKSTNKKKMKKLEIDSKSASLYFLLSLIFPIGFIIYFKEKQDKPNFASEIFNVSVFAMILTFLLWGFF